MLLVYTANIDWNSSVQACESFRASFGFRSKNTFSRLSLHQLSRVWEKEFESLLKLLTSSIVVHTDETSWSIKSVWAFLSEHSRVVLFGVNKDAKTLATVLDPASYKGTVVSDNAAVYGRFSKSQKCWAHLLRKAIKLTLLDPKNKEYTDFADGAFQIFYDSRSLQKNQSISQDQRNAEIVKLDDRVLALCSVREIETKKIGRPNSRLVSIIARRATGAFHATRAIHVRK